VLRIRKFLLLQKIKINKRKELTMIVELAHRESEAIVFRVRINFDRKSETYLATIFIEVPADEEEVLDIYQCPKTKVMGESFNGIWGTLGEEERYRYKTSTFIEQEVDQLEEKVRDFINTVIKDLNEELKVHEEKEKANKVYERYFGLAKASE
jgi:hypothetical protein